MSRKEYSKRWYMANRDKLLAYAKQWAKNNPEKRRATQQRHKERHPDRVKELLRVCRQKLKAEIINAYGGKCTCCGQREPDFLTVDHINNTGAAHRREIGRTELYAWLKRNGFPKDEFQLLCWNCNMAKGRYGSCPHKRRGIMPLIPPPDAEFILVPRKWLALLQQMARGPFLPIDFPLPIIVNGMVDDDEIWWGRSIKINDVDNYEIIKKEKVTLDKTSKGIITITDAVNDDQPIKLLDDKSKGIGDA